MIHFRTAMIVPIIFGLIYIVIVVIAVIVANISITIITIIVFRKLLLPAISYCHSQFPLRTPVPLLDELAAVIRLPVI